MFEITHEYAARSYLNFSVPSSASFDVFLLTSGTELQLATQVFYLLQPVVTVHSESLVKLRKRRVTRSHDCKEVMTINFMPGIRSSDFLGSSTHA